MKNLTKSYHDYLKSEKWKLKRELWFARYGRWCRGCGKKTGPLHLDHMTYERFGNELLSDLIAFCPQCHRDKESFHYRIGRRTDGKTAAMAFIANKRATRKRPKS